MKILYSKETIERAERWDAIIKAQQEKIMEVSETPKEYLQNLLNDTYYQSLLKSKTDVYRFSNYILESEDSDKNIKYDDKI